MRKVALFMLGVVLACTAAEGGCDSTKEPRTVCVDTRNTRTTKDDVVVSKKICDHPHSRRFIWKTAK